MKRFYGADGARASTGRVAPHTFASKVWSVMRHARGQANAHERERVRRSWRTLGNLLPREPGKQNPGQARSLAERRSNGTRRVPTKGAPAKGS